MNGERFGDDLDDLGSLEGGVAGGVASGERKGARPTARRGPLESDEEDAGVGSVRSGHAPSLEPPPTWETKRQGPKFSEKLIEVYQEPWQPTATPTDLQNRFMVSTCVSDVCTGKDNLYIVDNLYFPGHVTVM